MRLLIFAPDSCRDELQYVLKVIFSNFLGIEWCLEIEDRDDFRITLLGEEGEILLPSVFFPLANNRWLGVSSLPQKKIKKWNIEKLGISVNVVSKHLPILFGSQCFFSNCNEKSINLPADIFGSVFFMLSRYEEALSVERDNHDRFPASASIALKEGFLDRPIVDEYVELIWSAINRVWPALKRKIRNSRTLVSCDVDHPYTYQSKSLFATLRMLAGDVVKRRSPVTAMHTLNRYLQARLGSYDQDPYMRSIEWIMDENELVGNQVAFYFIAENLDPTYDSYYSLNEPQIRKLLRKISSRGHEIGIHTSYRTYKDQKQTCREFEILSQVMREESIHQEIMGGRQHYLRWSALSTPQNWEVGSMHYDSTLSYAETPGFRCGTCHEYPMFDLVSRKPLNLIQRPLILMECSVINEPYMAMGYTMEALDYMKKIKQLCYQFNGNFWLLWHNSEFMHEEDKFFYQELIK